MSTPAHPSPELFFRTVNAYQATEALKAAVELELFAAIGSAPKTAAALAKKTKASERGVRILADFLVLNGFLLKKGDQYEQTIDSAAFLDKGSPHYLGSALEFMLGTDLRSNFTDLAGAVRKGGTVKGQGSTAPEHPMWIAFARGMAPVTALPAKLMSELLDRPTDAKLSVLDIAAGHGMFGIAFARRFPKAKVFAQDWKNVLPVAEENAKAAGCRDRLTLLPGSAFDVDLGKQHDVVLLTNFLHHFDRPTCIQLLKRLKSALAPGGVCMTLEFVVDASRLSPPTSAAFALIMLASTPAGDAYTFEELAGMFSEAGFAGSELKTLMPGMQQVVVSRR